jgi:hypothetical protein
MVSRPPGSELDPGPEFGRILAVPDLDPAGLAGRLWVCSAGPGPGPLAQAWRRCTGVRRPHLDGMPAGVRLGRDSGDGRDTAGEAPVGGSPDGEGVRP